MLIDNSNGEVLDKLTILEIKQNKIKDETRLIEIRNEIDTLSCAITIKNKYILYYKLLFYINLLIWNETDEIKSMKELNNKYAEKSFLIFELNQQRFRIKSIINNLTNSNIKEQKSYTQNTIILCLDDDININDIIVKCLYLILHYDKVILINNKYSINHINIIQQYIPLITFTDTCDDFNVINNVDNSKLLNEISNIIKDIII